jgi:hypothetical protein
MFKFLLVLIAALAAVTFPIYFVIFMLRVMILAIVGPILGIFMAICWKMNVWSEKRKGKKVIVLKQ